MCILVVYLYIIKNEVVNPLSPRKYIVLSGNFVFDLPNFDLQNVFRNVSLAQNETCMYKNTQANSYPHNTLATNSYPHNTLATNSYPHNTLATN